MPDVEIDDLIDQAETRASALSLQVDQAGELLDSVDEMLDNWTETIVNSSGEAQLNFEALSDRLATSETNLEQWEGELRESLANLTQKVEDCGNRVQTSLTEAIKVGVAVTS
jgi:uncharacterized protein Yka (UPF0111/DUF47 family)